MSAQLVDYIDIVFDGPPGPVAGRFVEVEDSTGRSLRFGEWVKRADGYWALRITEIADLKARAEAAEAKLEQVRAGLVKQMDAEEVIARDLRAEVERLTQVVHHMTCMLADFGEHEPECGCSSDNVQRAADCGDCECGLREAVKFGVEQSGLPLEPPEATPEEIERLESRGLEIVTGLLERAESAPRADEALVLVAELRAEAAEAERDEQKQNYLGACQTVAAMHAAAVGEVTGPKRGVVEDVADLRAALKEMSGRLSACRLERDRFSDGYRAALQDRHKAEAEVERLVALLREARGRVRTERQASTATSEHLRALEERLDAALQAQEEGR